MKPAVIAYIGLGSNLEEPLSQLKSALLALGEAEKIQLIANSGFYSSPPLGPKDQPDYTNAVAEIKTMLSPDQLLACCQNIENQQGRQRSGERWGARTLDLDILTYGEQIIQQADLVIPHPGISQRGFVLYPLQELTDQLSIIGLGSIQAMINQLSDAKPNLIEFDK